MFRLQTALLFIALTTSIASAITINSTTVSGNQLTIGGAGFNGQLGVSLNGQKLTIVSNTSSQIVATMNPVPGPGSYRLVVKAGNNSTFAYVTLISSATIVAQINLVNETDTIQLTPILTPLTDSLYRVSVNMLSNGGPCNFPGDFELSWTDDGGPRTTTSSTTAYEQGGIFMWTAVVRAKAGFPLSYYIGVNNPPCNSYNAYATVEQVQ
jgi:hypothetical protein